MGQQLINPERQKKRQLMKELKLKTGKQYRKYIIKQRRISKGGNLK